MAHNIETCERAGACDVLERVRSTVDARSMAGRDDVALLMVSGGSDSVALAVLRPIWWLRAIWVRWPCFM